MSAATARVALSFAGSGETTVARIVLGAAFVVYIVLGIGYAVRTPIWQNPDEPAHVNYVAQLATTGTLPELRTGDWDSALLERLKNGRLAPDDSVGAIRYEGWQPPLYYLLAVPAFRAGPLDPAWLAAPASGAAVGDAWPIVLRLRVFDVLLGGITVLLAFFAAREVLPPSLASGVPLALAGVPMFTAVSSAISDDALADLFGALLVLVLLRSLRARPTSRAALGIGALLGLALLTKLALAIFIPLALLVFARRAAALLGATAVVVAPWLVRQVSTYGWLDPLAIARHSRVVTDQPRFGGFEPSYVAEFLQVSFHSFWAQFGWMAIPAPDRLYWAWAALTLLALGGLIWRRGWLADPRWRLVVGTLVLAVLAYVGYNLTFQQFQGRYLFTALAPFGMLLVLGWSNWLPVRLSPLAAYAGGLALIALNAYALTRVLGPGFGAT